MGDWSTRFHEPWRAAVLNQKEFQSLIASQPWGTVSLWQDNWYQYAVCDRVADRHIALRRMRLCDNRIFALQDTSTRRERQVLARAAARLAVMAKAPRPGKVKTRLSPPLTPDQASALNICFIRDTTENIQQVTEAGNSAGLVVYTPVGDEAAFDGLLPAGFQLLGQRGDGFGERLLHACEDLFACGFSAVCLIDSDSPTMPQARAVAGGRAALASGRSNGAGRFR